MTGRRPEGSNLPDPDFCHYATGIFLPLLMHLETELQGVVRDDDIEYIHRSRVATRRIRAAFTLFSACFPPKLLKKYTREIRRLTRSLGEARDLDVQIEFITSFLAGKAGDSRPATGLFSVVPHSSQKEETSEEKTAITIAEKPDIKVSARLIPRISRWLAHRTRLERKDVDPVPLPDIPRSRNCPVPVEGEQSLAGLECLLLRLIQRRRVMQSGVAEIVTRFLEKGTIQDLTRHLHDLKVRSMLGGRGTHQVYSYEQAFLQIMVRVSDLFWYEPYLSDPTLIHQHHEMRIAAKRLRYTLEAFADLYDNHLKSQIRAIKKIQEFLGDLHDCDVWIGYLPVFLKEEEEHSVAYFGNNRFFGSIRPGISLLMEERRENRGELFDEFCKYWERLKEEGFWDLLSEKISIPVQTSFAGEGKGAGSPVSIAVISDVHANLPALEAVLADAEERGVTVVLNAGDMIGYGPFPDEVVSLIRSRHILSVIGNYDLSVISRKWKSGKPRSRVKQVAMRWAYHNLSKENRIWLKSLPKQIRLSIRGTNLLVTHGSPDSLSEYLDNGTPESRLLEIASGVDAGVVVSGHSHRSAARKAGGVWFVNPGSVGRSEDGDPRACYALITVDPFSLTHLRIPYNVERTISAIRERHLPDAFARIVREGRPLEMVQDE